MSAAAADAPRKSPDEKSSGGGGGGGGAGGGLAELSVALREVRSRPLVSLRGLERCRSSLEDFVLSYFMFHGLDPAADFWRFMPALTFAEAAIYDLDEDNEQQSRQHTTAAQDSSPFSKKRKSHSGTPAGGAAAKRSRADGGDSKRTTESSSDSDSDGSISDEADSAPLDSSNSVAPSVATSATASASASASTLAASASADSALSARLLRLSRVHARAFVFASALHSAGLLDGDVLGHLEGLTEYWRLERALCGPDGAAATTRAVVERALRLKSSDYRLLNALLYRLTGRPANREHCAFLEASELLIELGDDLFDYEKDVQSNAFNTYRMFVRLYGPSAAPTEMMGLITRAERTYADCQAKYLSADLRERYRRRCAEAMRAPDSTDKWTIPTPVADEDKYRKDSRAAEATAAAAGAGGRAAVVTAEGGTAALKAMSDDD